MKFKEDNVDVENPTRCWICKNDYIDNEIKVRRHCYITGEYRGFVHINCNINAKLNCKISAVFCKLKDYGSQHFMQKIGKLNLKINVIPYLLERYLSFTINKKSSFIESVRFLRFSFDSLSKDDFTFFTQKFDNKSSSAKTV